MTKKPPAWTDGIDSVSDYHERKRLAAEAEAEKAAFAPLREWIAEFNPEALLADGYEDAILGITERCGCPALVVYDAEKCIEILMTRDGMDYEEAYEFFHFNTLGCWAGENSPLYLWRFGE